MSTNFFLIVFLISTVGMVAVLLTHYLQRRSAERRKIQMALKKQQKKEAPSSSPESAHKDHQEKKTNAVPTHQAKKAPRDSQHVRELMSRAEILLARDESEEAKKIFIQILSIKKNHQGALQKLAYIYLQTQSYAKAETLYMDLVEVADGNPGVYTNLGLALFHQKKFPDSIAAYQKAIELDQDQGQRYINLGKVYLVMEQLDAAIDCFQRATEKECKNIGFWNLLAETYAKRKIFSDARKCYEYILEFSPYNEDAKEGLQKLTALMDESL